MQKGPYTAETHSAFVQRLVHLVSSQPADTAVEILLAEAQVYLGATQASLWAIEGGTQNAVLICAVPRSVIHDVSSDSALLEAVRHTVVTDEPRCVQMEGFCAWLLSFGLDGYPSRYVISLLFEAPVSESNREVMSTWFSLLRMAVERLQARVHLQQAQYHTNRRLREVTALYEIGQAMEASDLQVLLDMITRKATEVMEAQACSLMLRDEDEQVLVIRSSYGLPEGVIEETRVPWGYGIAGRVAANGEAVLITDPRLDPRLNGEDVTYREDIVASMCVPLRDRDGQVMGVLNIHRRKPAPVFNEQDIQLFSVFAMQAASAIKNARLYWDLVHRVHELSVLSKLSAVVNSTLELEQILQQTADGIVETVRFDRCAIFLLDEQGKAAPRALRGYSPETLGKTPVRVADGIIGRAVQSKELVLLENAQQAGQPARGFGRMLGTNAFLVAPILARDRVIGVVVADNKPSRRPIEHANIQLLATFINQAGMAIENARLYQDLDSRYSELHDLWEYTRSLLRSIGVGVMSIDREENVRTWNDAAERITTITESAALGCKMEELANLLFLPADEKELLLRIIRHPLQTGERYSHYKCVMHPFQRGEMYFNFESSPLRAPNGSVQGVVFVFEDITREVRMEAEFQRHKQLATVGLLASSIAHELRNPLSSIRASAQHLRSEPADLDEFLDIIIAEVDTLNHKATEFLRFARPVQPSFQNVNLSEVVQTTVQFMYRYFEEQNIVTEIDAPTSLSIIADPALLKELLINLIINAVQAMSEGGTLSIRVSPALNDAVSIVIRDTGVGIPPENLDRVFTPFFTTKAKGTGLGLAIVQQIVDSHCGTVSLKSEVGIGTEMRVVLPRNPSTHAYPPLRKDADNLRANPPDF